MTRRRPPTPTFARAALLSAVTCGAALFAAGCAEADHAPPPRVGPLADPDAGRPRQAPKPLPDPALGEPPAPPFADAPLVYQAPPEQRPFVDAYAAVGRPRIAVFVNRTPTGELVGIDPAASPDPALAGRYDEVNAKAIDYATIENVLTQWLAADGQTVVVSPATVRQRLTDAEVRRLEEGRPRVLGEVARQLDADVLVHVLARPTRQTEYGAEVRLVAEAVNIKGGESIARATVLVPPPMDTEKVNRFTRYVARRLMADMTLTWTGPGPDRGSAPAAPPAPPPPDRPRPTTTPSDAPPPVVPQAAPSPLPPVPVPPPLAPPPATQSVPDNSPPAPPAPATAAPADEVPDARTSTPEPAPVVPSRVESPPAADPAVPAEKPSILQRQPGA